ncbi:B-cell antigen receptor complex-associated protein beta chain isoform X2 [Physeter macrocephalus]|uniref:B-cell antigen receptor complex-associated protein beta chain n=1 Tax=Physeter macrocephalus TaxID=9755 RepID=A0A2Y9FL13_PHYMC|nr:B-cell antigen receptor complex-associated protein beta chain isoform X2 [Physeter catodon]|eukprot:XP_007126000.1 B-cell antigen receptor complex-associated protein beta chain isoform X2 [Physeter catodon]
MAGPALRPGLSDCVLLLLLFSGETVLEAKTEELYRDPKGSVCSWMWQHPRFVAKKRGSMVEIKCHLETRGNVSWLRKQKMDSEAQIFLPEKGRILQTQNASEATLIIQDVQFQDNGIYFCEQKCFNLSLRTERGCGTELRVMGFSTLAQLKRRNTLKDGIIMIQTLLIILFIIVPIFLLLDKDDSKAGMEEDHTYEGLDIDQTATYEDIVTLRTGEVKWSVGEHPGQE